MTPTSGQMTTPRRARRPRRSWTGWIFLAPFIVLFAGVVIAPIVYAGYLSLFRTRIIGGTSFVWLDNYAAVLADEKFWGAIGRVGLFAALQVPVMLLVALLAALAIDGGRLAASSTYRLSIFLPYAVPGVVAALLWGYIYGANFGLVGTMRDLGIPVPDLLSSPFVLGAMANIGFWLYAGYNMLIYQAALKAIPQELYEAAAIDGASPLRVIWSIKLPAVRPAVAVTALFSFIGAFQLFNEPRVLEPLAPNTISSSFSPNLYAYNLAFNAQRVDYAATVALTMGLLTVVAVLVVQRISRRKDGAQ
jgi:multiple sugar transport system permease protein